MLSLLVAALPLLAAVPARADLTVCNRTTYRMQVAIGIERRANVETRGWFQLDPGQCSKVLDGALEADMTYVHARTPPVYGSAPLPQNGNESFCVGQGNFEFSDARGCPLSQQARFAAAKPSDSDKGPTIGLAEQADYDAGQARLAGIQRLLSIAGYDANPIDGVDGAKTQRAIARFLRDRKLAPEAMSRPDFIDRLIAAGRDPQGPGFVWCNGTHYTVMAAVGTVQMGAIVTRGWYRIVAGQCLRPEMSSGRERLYSYAEAVDAEGRTIERGGAALAWGGQVPLCIRDSLFEVSNQKDCVARGLNSAGFAVIDLSTQSSAIIRFKEP
ncbi:MAG TPA: DUF1036 domain-containing protein [Pseudolabrys sp.]|nr:DUF1036 domain-containing protein [Pseudolabrys sp.]